MNKPPAGTSYRCPQCDSILRAGSEPFCRDCGVRAIEMSDASFVPTKPQPEAALPPPPPPSSSPGDDSWKDTPPVESFAGYSKRAGAATTGEPRAESEARDAGADADREPPTAPSEREPTSGADRRTGAGRTGRGSGDTGDRNAGAQSGGSLLEGARQVEADIKGGWEIHLVAGIPSSGKTQLLEAYERIHGVMARDYDVDDEGRARRNLPATIIPHYLNLPPRKVSLLDAPGELFYRLLPLDGLVSAHALELQQLIGRNLSGVILAIDLVRLWAPELAIQEGERPQQSWGQQVEVAAWNLAVLRWARFGETLSDKPRDGLYRSAHKEIRRQVGAMKERLDVPVLVVLTKADQLRHVEIPGWRRKVAPETEPAIFLVRHALPKLYAALLAHADVFRCDFAFSLMTDPVHGAVVQGVPPCGVDLNLRWLLDTAEAVGRRDGHRPLPTRRLLALQERWDRLTLRGRRWDTLVGGPG